MAVPDYKVHASAEVISQIRRIAGRAAAANRLAEFMAAINRIMDALRADPTGSGESRGRLPHLRLEQRIIIDRPLIVQFGVNRKAKTVWVKSVRACAARASRAPVFLIRELLTGAAGK